MRNRTFMHTARDDSLLGTMRFISRHADTQVYGAILPKAMTNQALLDSIAYKTYYAIASGAEPPKPRKSQKKSDLIISSEESPSNKKFVKSKKGVAPKPKPTKKKAQVKADRGKGLNVLSEVALSEASQLKEATKQSKKEFHASHASGSGDGTDLGSGVPNANLTPTTSEATTLFPSLLDFSSVFKFNNRVTNLEKYLSEIKQVNQYAQSLSSIPAIVDRYIDNKLGEAIQKAILAHNLDCREEAQAEKRDYIELVDTSMRDILKEEKNVIESLAVVLARSSSQPKFNYKAAASLSEFKLTKILIDKMEKNKSYDKADYKRELYDALVKSYQTVKDLFDTYGEVFTLNRNRDDRDKDQDPSAGSDRVTEKRKSRKEAESFRYLRSKVKKSSSTSKDASHSQHKPSGKSTHAEEPSHTVDDSRVQRNQEFNTGNNDEQPANKGVSKTDSQVAHAKEPTTSFDELINTPIEFSTCVLNGLNIKDLTQAILVGPAFDLLKGTCKSLTELEYHLEECSKATTKRLDWHNPEGKPYPFDLSKPLPLIPDHRGRQVIPGKCCEKNYSSVRRYVADPDNVFPERSITKLILKKQYYKDDSCWSVDLKSKTTEDIISIGSFVEVLDLNQYVEFRRISLTGFRSCTSRSYYRSISKQTTRPTTKGVGFRVVDSHTGNHPKDGFTPLETIRSSLLLEIFFSKSKRLGRYPTSVRVFDDPILFLVGLKPSWEFGQQRPAIIVGEKEMAFRNFISIEDDDDLAFLPKEPSLGFGTSSPSASVNMELPKDVEEPEVQPAEVTVDSRESPKASVFVVHPGSVASLIKERKCKTRGCSSRPHVNRKLASGSSSSHAVRAKNSASKDDDPILSIFDDDEGKFLVHLVLSEVIKKMRGEVDVIKAKERSRKEECEELRVKCEATMAEFDQNPVVLVLREKISSLTANVKGHKGPVTADEKTQKNNDVKARSMLLMALLNEHLMTFNQYKDAKTLFAAIQTRFGGNDTTKKTQKTLLKQIYENFSAPSTKSLDSIFNRIQKIVSQLAILGENISQEDLNLKFLRSLPSEWNTHVVVWRNKPDLDTMSFDDLYNNSKIVEQELALLSMRTRKFFQKTGRKITINGSETAGYDKSKVECFSFHKLGHFARECRGPRNQDNRSKNQDN
ncbi:retrovirus-related pol polyprotein from transposon TNT 1-94 [Tanacetum coccineum]